MNTKDLSKRAIEVLDLYECDLGIFTCERVKQLNELKVIEDSFSNTITNLIEDCRSFLQGCKVDETDEICNDIESHNYPKDFINDRKDAIIKRYLKELTRKLTDAELYYAIKKIHPFPTMEQLHSLLLYKRFEEEKILSMEEEIMKAINNLDVEHYLNIENKERNKPDNCKCMYF